MVGESAITWWGRRARSREGNVNGESNRREEVETHSIIRCLSLPTWDRIPGTMAAIYDDSAWVGLGGHRISTGSLPEVG